MALLVDCAGSSPRYSTSMHGGRFYGLIQSIGGPVATEVADQRYRAQLVQRFRHIRKACRSDTDYLRRRAGSRFFAAEQVVGDEDDQGDDYG